jgi:hypothetical protein
MNKPWSEMTAQERLADRIAKNRAIDERVGDRMRSPKETGTASRQKAGRNALDKFQQIKATQGLDAAADFVRDRKP